MRRLLIAVGDISMNKAVLASRQDGLFIIGFQILIQSSYLVDQSDQAIHRM